MYPGAGFYGIKEILLSYAKLPGFLPFPVAVQHGWQRIPTNFEASATPPEIWVWSPRIASEIEAYYPKNKIRVIGSFFCYLMETLKKELPPVEKRGSICIPPHSSHFASNVYSVEDFARTINELGDEYKPITVMLYYLDMDNRTISEYEQFGFKVVSNGSLFEKDFLKNFVCNVYDKKNCIFSDFGSAVLYAADLGLNLVKIDIMSRVINRGNEYITDEMIENSKIFDEDIFLSLNNEGLSLELGKPYMLSPSELRKVILRNYFTWNFAIRSSRRVAGMVLRSIGLLRKEAKLK